MPQPTDSAIDEVIEIEDISVSPRGRKPEINSALADTLSKVPTGKAIRLAGTFGNVAQADRAKVSQSIRKHWAHVRSDVCRINYSSEGVPQVSVKV